MDSEKKVKEWEEWLKARDAAVASWWWIIRHLKCRRDVAVLAAEIDTVVRSGGKWGGSS